MVYKIKNFANGVAVGITSGKVELGADSGDLVIKSGDSTSRIRPGVGMIGQEPVTIVANKAALPLPPTGIDNGALYFTTASNELFMKSGGGWYRVSMVNTSPSISLDVTSKTISSNTPLDITYTVTEPEGTPTTVAITDGIPDSAVTITHTTSNNHVRAIFDGSTTLTSNTITFTATDGVNTGVATCTINTSYQTTFTWNTSLSNVNSNYTTDNKVEAVTTRNGPAAITQQSGKLGKGYFEMKLVSRSPNEFFNFFLLGVQVGTNTGGFDDDTGVYIRGHQSGAWADGYPDGSSAYGLDGAPNVNMTKGQTLMVAYDTDAGTNGQVWFGKNGTWGRDPASETGFPVGTDASSAGFRPAISYFNSSGSSTTQVEIISHTQGAQYTIPTGWSLA